MKLNKVICGDCLQVMKDIPDKSIDSIVTDPPYELGFMGKKWDNSGIAYNVEMWKECLRVLKPGGHLLSFGGTRTYHRMAVAIEDAGFEVRDMIEWVYGSGFPKSLNIGKAVDKIQGNERKKTGLVDDRNKNTGKDKLSWGGTYGTGIREYDKGTSEWEGWGTALKPAHEPICMARKPLAEKTVAENCLKYGTGGINIDESRVGTDIIEINGGGKKWRKNGKEIEYVEPINEERTGRFPANIIHDNSEEVRECFPETKTGSIKPHKNAGSWKNCSDYIDANFNGDSGNASRFFKSIIYTAKASKSERNKGCEELEEKQTWASQEKREANSFDVFESDGRPKTINKNNHPTVKPIALMEYLIKMVTPKGGLVLDPFAGSGTTLVAAKQNGFDYIGIEITEEYVPIIEARLSDVKDVQEELFNKQITNLKEK